jgi:hypothetical protein
VEDRFFQGLHEVCSREWWSRVWTIQEFALAKRAVFRCGSKSGDLMQLNQVVHRVRYPIPPFGSVHDVGLIVFNNIGFCNHVRLRRRPGSPLEMAIDALMSVARWRVTEREVDKVFGLLSISSAAARDSLKVQYEGEGYWTTWIRWAHIGLQEYPSHNILIHLPWVRHPRLPSWCQNLDSPITIADSLSALPGRWSTLGERRIFRAPIPTCCHS